MIYFVEKTIIDCFLNHMTLLYPEAYLDTLLEFSFRNKVFQKALFLTIVAKKSESDLPTDRPSKEK